MGDSGNPVGACPLFLSELIILRLQDLGGLINIRGKFGQQSLLLYEYRFLGGEFLYSLCNRSDGTQKLHVRGEINQKDEYGIHKQNI